MVLWINVLPAVPSLRNLSCLRGHFAGDDSDLTAQGIAGLGDTLGEELRRCKPLRYRLRNEVGNSEFGVAFFLKKVEPGVEQFVSKSKPRLLGMFFMLDQKIINAYYGGRAIGSKEGHAGSCRTGNIVAGKGLEMKRR